MAKEEEAPEERPISTQIHSTTTEDKPRAGGQSMGESIPPKAALLEQSGSTRDMERGQPCSSFPSTRPFCPRPLYELFSQLWQRTAALVGLLLLSPLLIALAVAVKLSSSGPAFYRGARVGRDEESFQIFKFRTMKIGSEQKIGQRLVQQDEDHYTKIGKTLRRYRLDELPQLINVLRGEMALVGPRPLRPIFLDEHKRSIEHYARRFVVRPGITGLAQVRGGYYTHPRHKLFYDLLYISRRSIPLDLRLICLTFLRVLTKVFTLSAISFWLFLLILTLPKSYHLLFTVHLKALSFNLLYLLPLIGCALHLFTRHERGRGATILRTPFEGPLLFFFLSGLCAAAMSWTPTLALRGVGWYLCNGLVFFYLHTHLQRDEARGERVLRQLLALALIVIMFSASMGFLEWRVSGQWQRIEGTFEDPLYFAAGLSMLLPLSWQLSPRWRWLLGGIFTGALILCGSRLGLIASTIAALIFSSRSHLSRVWLGGGCLALVLLINGLRADLPRSTGLLSELEGQAQAQYVLLKTIPTGRIVAGVGPRSLENYLNHFTTDHPETAPLPRTKNQLLRLWLTFGLLGALALFLCVYRWWLIIWQRQRKDDRLRALVQGVVAGALFLPFTDLFSSLPLMVLFWSLAGASVGRALKEQRGPRHVYRLIHEQHPL